MKQTTIKSKSNDNQNANNREMERERESNNSPHKTSTLLPDAWEAEREEERQRAVQKKIREAIPERYQQATSEGTCVAGFGRDIVANVAMGAGLFFVGSVGVGKTWTACGIAADALRAGVWPVAFMTSSDICYELAGAYKAGTNESNVIYRLSRVELLVIDDLGKEKEESKSVSRLFDVINKREAARKSTLFTSNFDETQLTKLWSRWANPVTIEAIFSRFAGSVRKVVMTGPDRRYGGVTHV